MKAVVDRKAARKALDVVRRVAESRTTIPVLSYVKMIAKAGRLDLVATDLDVSIRWPLEAESAEPGEATADALDLWRALAANTGDFAVIESTEDGIAVSGPGDPITVELHGFPVADMPDVTELEEGTETLFSASGSTVRAMAAAVEPALLRPCRPGALAERAGDAGTGEAGVKTRVVFFSGGAASWMAAKRVAEAHGTAGLVLLFTDTRMEDESTYRTVREGAANVGGELVWLAEGRTPWEVFRDVRFLGNTRADPCSRILKREQARTWVEANCDPAASVLYLGIGWDEEHRCEPVRRNWQPYRVEFPLCERPLLSKPALIRTMKDAGLEPPDLYGHGFPHSNRGGFCIKAGQAHFRLLLQIYPERYAFHEAKEEELRELLGEVAILRDRRGGETRPMSLREFRERIEADDQQCDLFEWGGCGCFSDVEAPPS